MVAQPCRTDGSISPRLFKNVAIVDEGENGDIEEYKNVYVWKYKVVNGNLYKRKYNIVTGKWVGKWMPV